MSQSSLNNQATSITALVTGGSRGIGRSICIELAKSGYNLAFTYKSRTQEANNVVEEITKLGKKAFAYAVDLSDLQSIEKCMTQINAEHPAIDVLVNNAGISIDGLMLRFKPEDLDSIFNTNIRAAYLVTQSVLRGMMKAKKGSIIFMSSVIGEMGNAGQVAYSASKSALFGLTKSLAREVASRGIRANAIAPGFIETEMTGALPAQSKEGILSQVPLNFFGSPEDVANLVCFLASDKSRYITGQIIGVNGGLYM